MSKLQRFVRAASIGSQSYNPDDNTIEVCWTTGASVRRFDLWDGTEYDEVLSLAPGAARLERLNAGAPFLDTHDSSSSRAVVGSVVRGSAVIEDGKGTCRILLSKAADVAATVRKIIEGVIRNVSVGYWIHAYTASDGPDNVEVRTLTDWEPLEVSAVPIPADAGAQIRSVPTRSGGAQVPTGRAAEIRRIARKAGCVNLGEEHIRAGTSAREFFDVAAGQISGNRAPWSADLGSRNSQIEQRAAKRHWEGVAALRGGSSKASTDNARGGTPTRYIGGTAKERRDYDEAAAHFRKVLGKR